MYTFHGADSKTGCTMLAQCVAETLADEFPDEKILFLSLNGNPSNNYMCEDTVPIEAFKMQLDSGINVDRSLLRPSARRENFYFISGVADELSERYYFPETAERLLENIADSFRLIIADTGSRLDNGLAFGGLLAGRENYLVLVQEESCLKRFERIRAVYDKVGISFGKYVINKYSAADAYTMKYIYKRLEISDERIRKVERSQYGREADINYKSLLEFENDKFSRDIRALAGEIAEAAGFPPMNKKRKGHGKILFR